MSLPMLDGATSLFAFVNNTFAHWHVMCFYLLIQILPDSDLKPQAKHLQVRLEYLMRVLKKHEAKPLKPPKVSDTYVPSVWPVFSVELCMCYIAECCQIIEICVPKVHVEETCFYSFCI